MADLTKREYEEIKNTTYAVITIDHRTMKRIDNGTGYVNAKELVDIITMLQHKGFYMNLIFTAQDYQKALGNRRSSEVPRDAAIWIEMARNYATINKSCPDSHCPVYRQVQKTNALLCACGAELKPVL
jgi:hypothetical protein